MRLKSRSRMSASVLMSSVFASPGTPVIRQCPPVNSAINTCSTTSSCPTMTLRSSVRIRSRPSATRSALMEDTGSVGERIDNLVDAHAVRHGRVLDVAGIVLGIGPFPAVAHVRVPIDEQHRPIRVVEDRSQVGDVAAFFPAAAGHEGSETGDLRVAVHLVETAEDRMILRQIHDLAIGKYLFHLAEKMLPLKWTMEIVERRGTAAQEKFAKRLRVVLGELQVSRLDEIDPRIGEEPRIVERQDGRILNIDRRRRFDPPRQVLL